jgi:prepilin-type processing-associated H-X9-DG protein
MKKSTFALLAGLFLTAAVPAPAIPSTDLVGWWRAEGNALDNTGTHPGTLPYGMNYAPGKTGRAFDFDGQSRNRVSIPDVPDAKLNEAFTVGAWIFPRQSSGNIFLRGDDRPGLDPIKLFLEAGQVCLQFEDAANQAVRLSAPIQLNQWQHVAATFGRRGNLKLFINGELAAQTNTTLKPAAPLDPNQNPALGIGNNGGTVYQSPFNGLIDEVVLYARTLNQREILSLGGAGDSGRAVAAGNGWIFREVSYDGNLSDTEARFSVTMDAEAINAGESLAELLEGDVAVLPVKLPDQLKIVREGSRYLLVASHPGRFKFKFDVVAKIRRAEPWNEITFTGPVATIASVAARAGGTNTEVQLLSGTLLESARAGGFSLVKGFLGANQTVALRWQSQVTEVARKVLLTVDSTLAVQITPTDIKYTSRFHYDIVQGNAARLTLALPAQQALTRLVGEQIRDWQLKPEGDRQLLAIEFIKPVEKSWDLTLYTEQTVESADARAALNPPQPLAVERESGALTLAAEDMLVETDSLAGLRRVNAAEGALAAYRFNGRPFTLALRLKRIEPVIHIADRVGARLEETRLLSSHRLALGVEKAGVYTLDLLPPAGFSVADVRGEGVEDWKDSGGKLRVNFSARVLGARTLDVQLEQALKVFPEQIVIAPLRVAGAVKETAQIGAAASPGIRLKTGELSGLREMPVNRLPDRSDEILAFATEQPDWKLSLAAERLPARVVADVFNLVTIGDGIVGGSATIRYGLVNQGVQVFKVKLPPHCKNVEFTGPNIRRKELSGDLWTIGLQDKAWGGYTLVVTYDYQFDPRSALLPLGGIHALEVERETGSIAVTTAASLKLSPKAAGESLHRVDEAELAAADRALITRSVLLAYQYTGGQYDLALDVQRYEELPVLEAVADRTEIASVLTEAGEMLTQASFMVKNNEKQFQKFELPRDANLWGCYVNGQAAKPERDGGWVLVPLPRGANRDEAFAVDIVYAQTNALSKSAWARTLRLSAPRTDVPNTYAEWQLYVPSSQRLTRFGGSMTVAQGTTYELLDAWQKFLAFYGQVLQEAGGAILFIGLLAFLVIALVISAVRRGWNGVLTLLVVVLALAVLGAMLLPALASAKRKAQRINSVSNLKQIGIAVRLFSGDNGDRLPMSFDEMKNELGTDKVTYDTETGQRYTYLGGGMSEGSLKPESVLAYSPIFNGHCNVLFVDGSVQQMTASQFGELSQRGLVQMAAPLEIAAQRQRDAVRESQLPQSGNQPGDGAAALALSPPVMAPPATTAEEPVQRPAEMTATLSGGAGGPGAPAGAVPARQLDGRAAAPAPAAAPMAAGIRSIRIEIPRAGRSFLFTKVLNVGNAPLSIRAKITSLETFQKLQMAGQVLTFLLGLGLAGWQWRRAKPNSFLLTLALVLVIASVSNLLIAWRALHDALIVGLPVVLLAIIAWLIWKYWPRGRTPESAGVPPPLHPPVPGGGLPPVVAAAALLLISGPGNGRAAEAAVANVSIVSASYTGTVNDRVAQVEATLQLSSAQPDQTVPLFGDDVAVQQFSVKGGDAKLVREGNHVAVHLRRRGEAALQIKMLVKPGGDVTRRRLTFGLPPALASRISLILDQPDADVDFPTAISFNRVSDKDKTRVEAVMGSADHVELLWTPRVKRAAEVAATVFCQNAALVTVGGGVVNVRAMLDYQITQGELRQVRVQLPPGQRLLRVEGDSIRTWEIKEPGGGQILAVELLKGISPAYRLTLETEKVLEPLPATVRLETPQALDVKRETGLVALRGGEELDLAVDSAKELQRVDTEEFARAGGLKTEGLASVFRFLKPDFDLRVRAEIVQSQIEAAVRNHVRVGAEQVTISSVTDYTIRRAGVFALRLALPAGYRIEQVTGNNVLQWAERTENQARLLEVTLKERTLGAYTLRVELSKNFKELPRSLAIEGVYPQGAVKLSGFVSVAAEPGVELKTEMFDGLTEIPAVSLPDYKAVSGTGNALAYKFIVAEPKSRPEWKLGVATETVQPWLRAEIVNILTLTEAMTSGRALVRYDIANAPIKTLCVKVPAAFKNVEVSGPNIRSREHKDDLWCVELQNKTRGFYTLTITWEQPPVTRTNQAELTGVSAAGVERETGLLTVVAKPPLQVAERVSRDLQRADTRDFPEWAGRPDNATVLAYRYARPGYHLMLEAKRFDEAEVLQALVDDVRLTTVVADDGQRMTEMSLAVRNNGRQFLEVELPANAQVWSAFVAGQPVRPSRREGRLLLPLEQSGADETLVAVAVTFVDTNRFPKSRGTVDFVSPKLDVPLKSARWELFLPPNYTYSDFSGTMAREIIAGKLALSSFSLSEYAVKEREAKAAAKAEARKDVSGAWGQLGKGNLREASVEYNRVKVKSAMGGENAEAKQLEKQLRAAQASNLIRAQNDFSLVNNGPLLDPAQPPAAGAPNQPTPGFYDNETAEAQWTKLQQAQEIAAAKVQPLRINLPTRGLSYTFTQVLQTEVDKPLTIRLSAANARTGNWPGRLALSLTGFLVLWGIVVVALRRARHQM